MSQVSEIGQDLEPTKLTPPVIAIIGGGFCGVLVAVHLLRKAHIPLTIRLIESRPFLGRGIAYGTEILGHLLNVPAGKMSAFPDEPEHFLRWLEKQEDLLALWEDNSLNPGSFVPRKFYGMYGEFLLKEAIKNSPSGVTFEWIKDEAIGIQSQGNCGVITLKKEGNISAQKIVLALGNFPPSNPPTVDPTFYEDHQHYIGYPWSSNVFHGIQPDDNILLIGSGLTMIDLAISLQDQAHQGKIYVVSRHGLLPHSHQLTQVYPPLSLINSEPLTVLNLLRQIRQEIEKAASQGINWRSVIDGIRPETQTLWKGLSLPEKRRFLRHLRPYWEVHRHRAASQITAIIQELLERQQLEIYAGRVVRYQFDQTGEGIDVFIKKRQDDQFMSLRVNRVINCTGSECNYRLFKTPLIVQLLEQGLIEPDELNLGLKVSENGALIDSQGMISSILYTLGSSQKGTLWETTAIPEIRQQAVRLSQQLLDSF